MPAVTRLTDLSAGHDCNPPIDPSAHSPDVMANGLFVIREGDVYNSHNCPNATPHADTASTGSPTVIVNGHQLIRIGDQIGPDVSGAGSPNVFAGSGSFPVMVELEPGVTLIAGTKVYDQSEAGQKASARDEAAFSPSLGGSSVSGDSPTPGENEVNPVYQDCERFPDIITKETMTMSVSKWFKLAHCKDMPVAQRGLTAKQIACNWAALCLAILDPVYEQFKFSFNSGFRVASRDSGGDHGIGCAADISMPTTDQTIAMYKWLVHSGLPFSQIIYEKHNSAWVHVAFNGKGPKGDARTMWTYTGSAPYGHGGQNGQNLPTELA